MLLILVWQVREVYSMRNVEGTPLMPACAGMRVDLKPAGYLFPVRYTTGMHNFSINHHTRCRHHAIAHSEQVIALLQAVKKLGVAIAIDDFGTGYSSLRYLQQFPVDKLKLDGMFIRDLEDSSSSQGIVSSSIILAHSLGLKIVAECVETGAQLEYLRNQQCDCAQVVLPAPS